MRIGAEGVSGASTTQKPIVQVSFQWIESSLDPNPSYMFPHLPATILAFQVIQKDKPRENSKLHN